MCGMIFFSFPNFNTATIEDWEWISNLIPHSTVHTITYPSTENGGISRHGTYPEWLPLVSNEENWECLDYVIIFSRAVFIDVVIFIKTKWLLLVLAKAMAWYQIIQRPKSIDN